MLKIIMVFYKKSVSEKVKTINNFTNKIKIFCEENSCFSLILEVFFETNAIANFDRNEAEIDRS